MATKPIKFLELHYTMTQFLIIGDIVGLEQEILNKCETILMKITLIWMKMKLHAELT